ncbi:HAD-IA family hydrolase [uncultured Desulfovibrio sp.]|uniref:phosphoglycolate phosphatase n=1 Tax=Candidatus Desulfovibrio intestinavium TaxID=2838534 RepID=A0A9D2HL51_9BACT|nr:HAD-IA family hydrolase [uncultured Desulfovibrio sp.]HJA78182.1 HAD-IA family hydrolase [Candidatus Desulfovibrio intestinavium]
MRAFLFDLDGTLLDTLADIGNACNAMLAAHGYPTHPVEDYRRMIGNGFGMLVRRALPDEALTALRAALPDEAAVEALVRETRAIYADHLNDATRPYEGMPQALRELARRGMRLAVFSNKPDEYTRILVEAHFPGVFSVIRGARPDTPLKPDPAGALSVIAATDTTAGQCFYVGDSDVDMLTARNAGMVGVGVGWGFRGLDEVRAAGAERLVRHPLELPGLLADENPS